MNSYRLGEKAKKAASAANGAHNVPLFTTLLEDRS